MFRQWVIALLLVQCMNRRFVISWSPPLQVSPSSFERRCFLETTGAVVATIWGLPTAGSAYERRDVGGDDRSADTAALNIQAYATNNRLEREGVKVPTEEDQKTELAAALSGYSYEPSDKQKKSVRNSKNIQKEK